MKLIGKLLLVILALGIFAAVFLVSYVLGIEDWRSFDPRDVADMQLSAQIFDGSNERYAVLSGSQTRFYTGIGAVPEHVKNAFLATEDARFYEHGGVDYKRIAAALFEDIKAGGVVQGASTISQQLIKNSVLTGRQTVSRKLTEIMMAYKLEKEYTKDEILELYLNRIYFGRGAYGIEAAAQAYFGISAKELSIAQGAMLAGILKSPTNYAPHINLKKSVERRDLVIGLMLENGMITERQAKLAKAEKPVIAEHDAQEYPYGWYTDLALAEAKSVLGVSMEELLTGGYKIYTALDEELQKAADSDEWPDSDDENIEVAAVVLDAQSAEILAVRGGREHTARLGFSRATDMRRQPGSAIKPVLVFAPAVEYLGTKTSDFLLDAPETFGDYSPRNAGNNYKGWVTLREVVEKSINIPAVGLLEQIGVERAKAYASSVGIEFAERDTRLSLALGGFTTGVSPLELCAAYQPFASGGSYREAGCIRRILDKNGREVYRRGTEAYSVLSDETAFLVSSMLEGAAEHGTAKEVFIEGMGICAKTGTTNYDDANNNKDAWVAAYNADIIVCCWMGCDETGGGSCLPQGFTGGTQPARMARSIFAARGGGGQISPPSSVVGVELDKEALEQDLRTVRARPWQSGTVEEWYVRGTEPQYEDLLWRWSY